MNESGATRLYPNGARVMLPVQLALVSEDSRIDASDLARVSAAVQKQLTRDLAPIWDVAATMDHFPKLEDVPVDYWPIVISDKFTIKSLGIHLSLDGQPFALVKSSDSWSLTVSHEAMEAVTDPAGHRLAAGESPMDGQGRVNFLVEICDPCEHSDYAYTVNEILVSDFCTPHYFDPVAAASVRYSYTGAVTEPRSVLHGGYVSWHDPMEDVWWQLRRFDDGPPQYESLGPLDGNMTSIRSQVDAATPHPQQDDGVDKSDRMLRRAVARGARAGDTYSARASVLRGQIEQLQ